MPLRDYQINLIEDTSQKFKEGFQKPLVVMATGGGKCLGKGTPVMMYDKSTALVEDIAVGDLLMGDDFEARKVESLATGTEEMFRVIPDEGMEWTCNRSHILSLFWNSSATGDDPYLPNVSRGDIVDITVDAYLMLPVSHKDKLLQIRQLIKDAQYLVSFTLESIGEGDYYGFEISGRNRRFLLGDFTVTHNTLVAGDMIRRTVQKGRQVIFCVDRDVLVGQTYAKLAQHFDLGDQCGFIKAGYPEAPGAPIQIASIQTLSRRKWWRRSGALDPAVLFLDEAHITGFAKAAELLIETFPNSFVVGLTATPWRLSKKQGMGDIFDSIVKGPLPSELMEMGFLCEADYYSLAKADLSDVRTTGGDFNEADLAVVCNRQDLIEKAVDEWFRLGRGRRTLAFCVDVDHAINVAAEFRRRGVPAAHVDGSTKPDRRKRLYEAVATGELLVLTSVNVISIGFDEPSVEVGLMLRPTKSRSLWFQQLGRMLRISPNTGKERALILDQAGNLSRPGLGLPEHLTNEMMTLERGRRGGECLPGVKVCDPEKTDKNERNGCGRVLSNFVQECLHCGFIFERENLIFQSGNLEQYLPDADPLKRAYYVHVSAQAFNAGHSPFAADMQYERRYFSRPTISIVQHAVFGSEFTEKNIWFYFSHLCDLAKKNSKKVTWVKTCMTREFGIAWKGVIEDPDTKFNAHSYGEQMQLVG